MGVRLIYETFIKLSMSQNVLLKEVDEHDYQAFA